MISINAHFSGFFGTEEDSYIHPADWTLSVVAVEKKKNKKKLTSACPRLQPNMLDKHTVHWCHHHALTSACPWLHQDMLDKHTGHQCHHHSLQLIHDVLHKHFSGNFGVVRVLLAVMHFDPWRPVPPQTAQLAVPAWGGGSWLSGQDRSESFPDQKKIMLDVSVTSGVS